VRDTCSYPDFEVRDYILITKTAGRSEDGNTSIVQMTEENIRIQAGGELRTKLENIKMISFLVCTATLFFSENGVRRGSPPPPRNSEVLTKLSRNSLKVPKIKEILLYEMNFLVPNYSCL
jgi:hypothetical protein